MKKIIKTLLAFLGYHVQGTRYMPRQLLDPAKRRPLTFDDVICHHMFNHGQELTFVQVGVFDGVTHDPLRKFIVKCGWRGILVEPQSRAVKQLRNLYQDNQNIRVIHAALDDHRGKRVIFTVQSEVAPSWAGGLASFDRGTIIKHREQIPDIESMIREEIVDCILFDDVLATLSVTPDILQIDTEGADAVVLSLFPFERIRPAIVHWEIKHLTKQQREAAMEMLSSFGYRFAPSGDEDMLAVNF